MLKKMIAATAVLALFACSTDDPPPSTPGPSSPSLYSSSSNVSSSSVAISSSSEEIKPSIVQVTIASLNGDAKSEMFGTYNYVFALKAGLNEDLKPFWNIAGGCSAEASQAEPPSTCQLPMDNAILQHNLTNQYSELHYKTKFSRVGESMMRANALNKWNLTGNGDEATLGLNVSDDTPVKDIGDLGKTDLNNIVAFEYQYAGGSHEFRIVSKTDNDFWYYEVPASTADEINIPFPESAYKSIIIQISDLKGMGSYAGIGETAGVPFDISKAAKFLWSVKYNAANEKNNKGSLGVYSLKAHIQK